MLALLLGLATLAALFFVWLYFRELKRSAEYLERSQLVQQEKLIVVDFMHDMVQAIGEGLGKEELFQRIAHASIVSTGALSACVFEKGEDGKLRSVAVEGLYPPHGPLPEPETARASTRARFIERVMRSEEFSVGEGLIGGVAKSGRAVLVEDGRNDPRLTRHDDPSLAVSTIICAPITFSGEVLGVLSVCNSADGLPFSSTDFSVVKSLAEQAGVAINNNQFVTLQLERKQIDVDLAIARNVQQMLLPQRLPELQGLDLDARYLSSHSIGGDLFDVVRLDETTLGVAVADVSGKGIPASIIMAICRTNLHRVAQIERSPKTVLLEVNEAMSGELRQGMFVTVLYAVIDLAKGCITYARAGHERPLHCRHDRQRDIFVTEYPTSEGMPVGMFDQDLFRESLEERTLPFERGEVFVAYTDGVIETMNAVQKEYSASRLADVVKGSRKRSALEINDAIIGSLGRFSGKKTYGDDVTMVTVKRL
ncbi:SpoIIE family protein phosphatase [Pelagicoccus sp. SDUM812003]|uniref:SpoIIE family protein phosphatase n=1 Tax=Pelagicoccus sp. SDUM812003 TaxID=3041267 RepID=UPI00280D11D8|nr:SpoIIE family protein phosphatase [Pelagicoccus sp. SDUM812003]MDQ8202601.1 SpoIIE family protein phosphatase [Pelagicoccus sp. SDUM812003]